MSPAISPLVSALGRAAALIDNGLKPAAALRQVAAELITYETDHMGQAIPDRVIELGGNRKLMRVI